MTPRQKATDLREKFYNVSKVTIAGTTTIFWHQAKELALLAVDEILNALNEYPGDNSDSRYWNEVKEEIKKL